MKNQDVREQLYNERKTGTFAQVQLPLERVTTLHGFLLDVDPGLYRPGNAIFPPADDPEAFFKKIKPVLDRHPLVRSAEVRLTGTGLHLIVRLDPPVELASAADQARWDALVRVVQATLPVDPNAPGITAVTRPVGSVNAKNGVAVRVLRPGKAIDATAVEEFVTRLSKAPFKEVVTVLFGEQRISPCPVCKAEGSRLDVLDHIGKCYCCGKVTLAQVLDLVYVALPQASKANTPRRQNKESHSPAMPRPVAKAKRPKGRGAAVARKATKSSRRKKVD